jgi:hypothetical protein
MPSSSLLEQYRVADFIDWHKEKRLELNPAFQRGSVWTPAARSYLIDSILRRLSIPKVYLRTTIDVVSKKSIREVVDGQQRLRAILDFADDKFTLSKRASEFAGFKYSTLSADLQEAFLSYPIAVDQLLNASDTDVLEIFSRLNSYSVTLNAAEKRHAKFQGEFKWQIRSISREWAKLWESYEILSTRDRVRMRDDSLVAEMIGFLLDGVGDGAETDIDKLYKKYDDNVSADSQVFSHLEATLKKVAEDWAPDLKGTSVLRPPNLLMLFAATAAKTVGIPAGKIEIASVVGPLAGDEAIIDNLRYLSAVIDLPEAPTTNMATFWAASKANAHRVASRKVRFPAFLQAVTGPLAK